MLTMPVMDMLTRKELLVLARYSKSEDTLKEDLPYLTLATDWGQASDLPLLVKRMLPLTNFGKMVKESESHQIPEPTPRN